MVTTLEELIGARALRPQTRRAYLYAVRDFLAFAGSAPAAWTPEAAWRWRQQLEGRVARRQLAAQSANQKIHGVRTAARLWMKLNRQDLAYDFGVLLEPIPRSEAAEQPRALDYEEAGELLAACRGDDPANLRDYAMAVLGLHTGMRRVSLSALEFERIEWRARTMTIQLKGGRMHKMPPLDERTFEALEPWREWLARQGIRSGRFFRRFYANPSLDAGEVVGKSLSIDGVSLVFKKRARAAGLKAFTPHVLRHTFVTWMQDLQRPGYVIAAYTGHQSDAMVLRYTDAWLSVERQSPVALLPHALGGRQ